MKTLSTIAAFTFFVAAAAPAFAQTVQEQRAYQAEASQYYTAPVVSGRSVGQNPGFRCNTNRTTTVSPNGNPSLVDPRSC